MSGSRRRAAGPAPAKNNTPLIIGAVVGGVVLIVVLVLASGGRGGSAGRSGPNLRKALEEVYALIEQKEYIEADAQVHAILNQKSRRQDPAYGDAAALDAASLHALAGQEREARPLMDAWLASAEAFFGNPNRTSAEGGPLYDEGVRLRDRFPNGSRVEAVRSKVGDLARYKAEDSTTGAQEQYQGIAAAARACVREHDFAGALTLWRGLDGANLAADFTRKLHTRMDEVNAGAKEWLDELAKDAQKRGGAEGRKLLEDARPNLKGTAVEQELEERIRGLK